MRIYSTFIDFRVPQVVPAQNDADGDGDDGDGDGDDDDDEPTTGMPHSHQQANTHRDQISRSGDTSQGIPSTPLRVVDREFIGKSTEHWRCFLLPHMALGRL